jgi:molybdate transport system substrate-binding protein
MSDENGARASGSRKLLNLLLILAPLILVAILLATARQEGDTNLGNETGDERATQLPYDPEPVGPPETLDQLPDSYAEGEPQEPLYCYVGGTMYPVMQELARVYQEETGVEVLLDKAGSGENFLKIKEGGKTREGARADLNVMHAPYLDPLLEQDLGQEGWVVAGIAPVIAVPPGSEKVKNLKDLAKPGVQVGLTDAMYSTLGHILPTYFARAGIGEEMKEKEDSGQVVRKRSGGDICNDVVLGRLDACVVWNAVAKLREVDVIQIEEEYKPDKTDAITSPTLGTMRTRVVRVSICTLTGSDQPKSARTFAQFVDSPRGREIFDEFGFSPSPRPSGYPIERNLRSQHEGKKMILHAGAGLRPAVDACVSAFQRESGAVVELNYGGSGTLLGTLKTNPHGDIYLPGDVAWVEKLGETVVQQRDVAYFVPVILVQEGNPKNIQGLEDLQNVTLALGDPQACQIGKLTVQLIEKNNLDREAIEEMRRENGMEVPMLANHVKLGTVDAAIVWNATAANVAESTDVVRIPPEKNIVSRVTAGLLTTSTQPDLATDFMNFMAGREGRAIFREHGYTTEDPRTQED